MIKESIIIWDFDGVILNSNKIRDKGFEEVLKEFPENEVAELMSFHHKNGGLSRYVKFRYFFEKIRSEKISEEEVVKWAEKFSKIMLQLLADKSLIVEEVLEYVRKYYKTKTMHIVSASDQKELRAICAKIEIDKYFKSIHGSPTTKILNVNNLIYQNKYNTSEILLIGDSINDRDAAVSNNINFSGYNNDKLKEFGNYIQKFS
ncbi:HAD family hydrolase [Polaribacter gochangensis]|uniref:HAD family hydrolase n=1 Tax=Polaribacter gochangensis TaxID=3252903 RepID=UPI0039047174